MSRAKPKATYELHINDEVWTCRLWRSKTFLKMHADAPNGDAVTMAQDRIIDFQDSAFDLDTVGHELMHGHFKYLHLDSVNNPRIDDIEEIFASWMGANFIRFHERAFLIYNALKDFV